MKHIIAHRGNIDGPNELKENNPEQIKSALDLGFDVEIDVWWQNNCFYLGHDVPQYKVSNEYIMNPAFWCHAKNIEALSEMVKIGAHCFYHNTDDVTLTSKGFLWTYPGKKVYSNSICVAKQVSSIVSFECAGICTDYPVQLRRILND